MHKRVLIVGECDDDFLGNTNESSSDLQANVSTAAPTTSCSINGTLGIRLPTGDGADTWRCYAAFSSSLIPSTEDWSVGRASSFKANDYCHRIDAELASFDRPMTGESSVTLVNYLMSTASIGSATVWISLHTDPWVWADKYDSSKSNINDSSLPKDLRYPLPQTSSISIYHTQQIIIFSLSPHLSFTPNLD